MTGRQRLSARPTVNRQMRPAVAAHHITHDGIKNGDRIVLYCRVSHRNQYMKGNLDSQVKHLTAKMVERGAFIIDIVRHVGNGEDPWSVWQAAKIAKTAAAKIVAVSTDRFVRNPDFTLAGAPWQRVARANAEAIEALLKYADGCPLVTLLPPDTPLDQVMKHHQQVARTIKGNHGGRPRKRRPGYKKEIRQKMRPRVLKLHSNGVAMRQIAKSLKLSPSTVRSWVRHGDETD